MRWRPYTLLALLLQGVGPPRPTSADITIEESPEMDVWVAGFGAQVRLVQVLALAARPGWRKGGTGCRHTAACPPAHLLPLRPACTCCRA
jgi:hypothetical protein